MATIYKYAPEEGEENLSDSEILQKRAGEYKGGFNFKGSKDCQVQAITEFYVKLLCSLQGEVDLNKAMYVKFLIESCPFIYPDIKEMLIEDIIKIGNPNLSQRKFQHRYYKYQALLIERAAQLLYYQ